MNESRKESKRAQAVSHLEALDYDPREIDALFRALDSAESFDPPLGEFSIAFVSKEEISQIHQDFMNDPSPTDVITFPGDPDISLAGEICVCPEVARDYAHAHNNDFSEELTLYLVHGYLHLCGFKDIEDADREAMRKAEAQAMEVLRERQALPRFALET